MTIPYAGIGSRETPENVLALMTKIAGWLDSRGYRLRSGGAQGADTAFETGATTSEIFVPWAGFNGRHGVALSGEVGKQSEAIAARFHPVWFRCSPAARKLHSRNVAQILGADLASPSAFVVCWTKDGRASGGTGQALRIASHYGVPIFNLHDRTSADRLFFNLCREGVFA